GRDDSEKLPASLPPRAAKSLERGTAAPALREVPPHGGLRGGLFSRTQPQRRSTSELSRAESLFDRSLSHSSFPDRYRRSSVSNSNSGWEFAHLRLEQGLLETAVFKHKNHYRTVPEPGPE